ncbi:MAG: DEAD/DEAH box helicase [Candidatus Micrarchaeota archaeon]
MLRPEVQKLVGKKGFKDFTEIQVKAIPLVLSGSDVLVVAPTGWGKTESVVLPILSRLLDLRDSSHLDGIQVLYVTPLRALNRDLLQRLQYWCSELKISLDVRHGDTTSSQRTKQRDAPPQFLITTPETLGALFIAPKLNQALKNVKFVVVDELHELAGSKRGAQLSLSLARLHDFQNGGNETPAHLPAPASLQNPTRLSTTANSLSPVHTAPSATAGKLPVTPEKRNFQLIGLRATLGDPLQTIRFLSPSAQLAETGFQRKLHAIVELPERVEKAKLKGIGVSPSTASKLARIIDLIESHNKTLIFVNTRFVAESLASLLMQVPSLTGKIAVHHSSLAKEARLETEKEFKHGRGLKAVVCTSSLELGIDIGSIDLVIQYVSPHQATRFVQRIGRSGHSPDSVPKGVLVASGPLDALESVVVVSNAKQNKLESLPLRKNSLDALAQAVVGLALNRQKLNLAEAHRVLTSSPAYSELDLQTLFSVCKQLESSKLLYFDGSNIAPAGASKMYYYENLSMIPDRKRFFVKDASTRKNVGSLDDSFVSEYLHSGVVFITRGKAWRVLSVTDEEVVVEPSSDTTAGVPDWVGEDLPISFEVAQAVCTSFSTNIVQNADSKTTKKIKALIARQNKSFTPKPNEITIESRENYAVIHCFAGTKINASLEKVVTALLSAEYGTAVKSSSSPYAVLVELPQEVDAGKVFELLRSLAPEAAERVLHAVLPHTFLFRNRLFHVAKRFGVIRKDAEQTRFTLTRLAARLKDSPVYEETFNEVFFDLLDLPGLKKVLGASSVKRSAGKEWSALASEFFESQGFRELFIPIEPTRELIEAFEAELDSKTAKFVCSYCGKTHSKKVAEVAGVICPYCGSTQVGSGEFASIVDKKKKGKKLTADESRKYKEFQRTVSLYSSYNRRGVLALATFGVGPETAVRVLSRLQKTDAVLLRDLLDAQKNFIKTRRFWRL